MELYYLIKDNQKEGPFELMSMVKKLRNGNLSPQQFIITDALEAPIRADEDEVLAAYFADLAAPETNDTSTQKNQEIAFEALLKNSWQTFSAYQSTSIYVGVNIIFVLLLSLMLFSVLPTAIAAFLAGATASTLLSVFTIFIHNQVHSRGNGADIIASLKTRRGAKFIALNAALSIPCFTIPAALWPVMGSFALIILLIGCFGFSLFMFAPLIWSEQSEEENYANMMKRSMKWVLSQDVDSIGKILTLFALNLIAFSAFLFPLFFMLPLTSIALSALYEERVKHNI